MNSGNSGEKKKHKDTVRGGLWEGGGGLDWFNMEYFKKRLLIILNVWLPVIKK